MESLKDSSNYKIIKCPKCGSSIEITEGYVEWCEYCLWNLKPYEEAIGKDNIVHKIYKRMGSKFSKELFQSMLKSNSIKPPITIAKLLAFILSCIVFCISFISILLLVYLLTKFGITIFSIVLCLFLLSIAIAAFPRFSKIPNDMITRNEFPALYKLLDRITQASNCKEVYGVVINEDFNASYTEVGIKRRKIVYIGLPLFYILNDDEKVALLSHEIAHGINGDITRGFITGTAINTLITWYNIISPRRNVDDDGSMYIISLVTNLIMLALSKIILLYIIILIHLVYNDSQRAEYLADYIGASISGTDAMKSLLDKLHLDKTYKIAVQKAALSRGTINFFQELSTQINMIPKKELKRIKLIEKMEGSTLDATHPPTGNRITFMEQRDTLTPKVVLSESDSLLIKKEIETIKHKVERKLINNYKEFI